MKIVKSLFIFIFIIFCTGCTSSNIYGIFGIKDKQKYEELYLNQKYEKAALYSDENIEGLIGVLESGNMYRYSEKLKMSNKKFDLAENYFKADDLKSFSDKTISNINTTLLNDYANDYTSKIYERIMVNTYKAINNILLHDYKSARVEFNRVIERQQRAKEYFLKEIKEKQKEIDKEKTINKNNHNYEKDERTVSVIDKEYSTLFEFKSYPDFVNPFSTYIAGLFFYLEKDYRKATNLFKQAYGMDKSNYVFKNDLELSLNKAKSLDIKANMDTHTWIVIEDGLSMSKREERIDIPLFIFTSRTYYTGIALPYLVEREYANKEYHIKNGKMTKNASVVCDMDRVIKTEFKKRFPMIMTKAIISAVSKTILQQKLTKQTGAIGGILGSITQMLTTRADIRAWQTLPKRFLVSRVKNTEDRIEVLDENNQLIVSINQKNKNRIVFLKQMKKDTKVVYDEVVF